MSAAGPVEVTERLVATNGIELLVREAGPADGPLVVLAHGFPESAYAWRHQMEPLAAAGYRVLAPDQRGYGGSTAPTGVADYRVDHLHADLLGLLDEAGRDEAVFVGHDWGAWVVWDLARAHPERVRAVIGVSVPFLQYPMRPTDLLRALTGDRFLYILYFQTVGPAERELGADPRETLRRILWAASGLVERPADAPQLPAEGTGFLDAMGEVPEGLPPFVTEADLARFTAEYERSGFFGPVSWYRNIDANWELLREVAPARMTMPAWFIGGERDAVVAATRPAIDAMADLLPGFRGSILLPGVGHWTQQEDPAGFTAALLGCLAER